MGSDANFEEQEPFGGAAPRCVVCGVGLNRLEASAGRTCRNISCLTILAIRARDQAQRERQADVAAAVLRYWKSGLARTPNADEVRFTTLPERPMAGRPGKRAVEIELSGIDNLAAQFERVLNNGLKFQEIGTR